MISPTKPVLFGAVVIVAVAALVGGYLAFEYAYSKPCCAPEPSSGQLFIESYNFRVNSTGGSMFAVFGMAEGQNVTIQQVYYDQTLLTPSNSGVTASCGTATYGSPPSQWTGYQCTVSFSFGPSLPAPRQNSVHAMKIISSTGVSSSFQVTAGYLYEATSTTTA